MNANWQLPRRPLADRRPATLSAWAMSLVFAVIAIISFAVDQSVALSPAGDGAPPRGLSFAAFSPVQLINALIDTAGDRSDRAE